MKHPHLTDIKALKAQAIARLYEILNLLVPDRIVVSTADGFRIGNNGSLSVSAMGIFHDFETGKGGDVIALVEHVLKTDFAGAINFLKWFLGQAPSMPPVTPKVKVVKHTAPERIEKALRIWNESSHDLWVAGEYLHQRGIYKWPDGVLRYHPRLWNYTSKQEHPALIAAITDSLGNITAVQAIFLTPDSKKIQGHGIKAKLLYGVTSSNAIRLSQSGTQLTITEGLEDALSIWQCDPTRTVWATGGTSGLINIVIPEQVQEVVICADNDAAGEAAATKLATRLLGEGKRVRIARPPAGVKDFNEMICKGGAYA